MRVWKKNLLRRFDLSTTSVQSYKFPCHFQKSIQKTTNKTKTITFTQTTLDSTPTRAKFYINGHCLLIFICWKYEVQHSNNCCSMLLQNETQQFKLFGRIKTLKVTTGIHVISLHPLHMMMNTTMHT